MVCRPPGQRKRPHPSSQQPLPLHRICRGRRWVSTLEGIAYEFILVEWSDCSDGERI
jgi:hypothetical protein